MVVKFVQHCGKVLNGLRKAFTKPWKLRYGNIGLLAMLAYDLQRYHPEFVISVVDQVFEDVRQGLEVSMPHYHYWPADAFLSCKSSKISSNITSDESQQ